MSRWVIVPSGTFRSGIRTGAGSGRVSGGTLRIRAERPFPNPCLALDITLRNNMIVVGGSLLPVEEFPCELHVVPGSRGDRFVEQHGLPEARRFAQPHVARNHRLEH